MKDTDRLYTTAPTLFTKTRGVYHLVTLDNTLVCNTSMSVSIKADKYTSAPARECCEICAAVIAKNSGSDDEWHYDEDCYAGMELLDLEM